MVVISQYVFNLCSDIYHEKTNNSKVCPQKFLLSVISKNLYLSHLNYTLVNEHHTCVDESLNFTLSHIPLF